MLKPFVYLQTLAAELRTREEGQTMAEYGVVLAVITLGIILTLGFLSEEIVGVIERVMDKLKTAGS